MAAAHDPFESVRRVLADSSVLRHIQTISETGRRLSGFGVASNLDRLSSIFPTTAQRNVINVGTDITRLLAGSSAVTAWAEAQSAHARIAELVAPSVAMSTPHIPALQLLDDVSKRLSMHTKVLAHMQLPAVLGQATAESSHGWRVLVDQMDAPTIELPSTRMAGWFTVGTAVSARVMRPTIVDVGDDQTDDEGQHPTPLVDALVIGDQYRRQVRDALHALDPRLLERWDGAWVTLVVEGPDGPSQAAHSIQELIDWTLRLAAPTDDVLAWRANHSEARDDLNRDGKPTRGLMVRYIVGNRNHDETAKLFMSSLNKIVKALQQAKHGFEGPTGPAMIRSVLLNTESFLGFLLVTE